MRPPLDGLWRNPPAEWSRATEEDNALSWEDNTSRMKNHWQWFSTLQLLEGRILTLPPERGCVADQPQRLRKADGWNSPAASGFFNCCGWCSAHTAALRQVRNRGQCQVAPTPHPLIAPASRPQ